VYAGFDTATLALIGAIVLFGGLVKGLVGFGYAIASTAILASVVDPAVAVVVMILPTMIANAAMVRSLTRSGLRSCVRRFWPYVGAAVVGTLAGMLILGEVPGSVVAGGLGAFTLGYVLVRQDAVAVPGTGLVQSCFVDRLDAKVALGLVSGGVFGVSNAAVQVVASLDSLDLDRETFSGVLAMILLGVSSIRLGAAWYLDLFAAGETVVLSALAGIPGVVGVAAGERLRAHVPERTLSVGALVVLTAIGVRLLFSAVGL